MRKQKQIWLSEHTTHGTLPTMANSEPASGVVEFVDWLKNNGVELSGNAVDIGCGKGRNSVYLATLGYTVHAMDFIRPAIHTAELLAAKKGVADKIHFYVTEIDYRWPFDDNSFDIAIDSFSSIDIERIQDRMVYKKEMYRTLKPGGYALVTVCSTDDEWEKQLIAHYPGPERNSTIWPQNGKFQKDYDETELREFYKGFEILELKKIRKRAFKLGREGTATNFWLVLKKPPQKD